MHFSLQARPDPKPFEVPRKLCSVGTCSWLLTRCTLGVKRDLTSMRSMLPWNFSKSDHANKASSNVTLQPEPSLAHSPERVSWSKNPDEIDEEFPRDGPAAPRRHSATPQQQQHQQPTTPSQATPVPYEAQRNTAAHATPTTPVPRQIPGFFAVVPSPSPRDMQRQTSTSSVLSGNSSAGSGSLPPASFFISDQKTADPGDVFGEDYVARVKEVFYIREKPTVPQATDGVIRSPAMGGRQHDFHDAFKIDFGARSLTLQDLPSKVPILTIKKRVNFKMHPMLAFCARSTHLL